MARGLQELDATVLDSVAVLSYNFSSPFRNAAVNTRQSYYGVSGTPTIKLDGNRNVEAGTSTGTSYGILRYHFDQRKVVASNLVIDVNTTYDSATRAGVATVKVRNTSGSAISAQLQVALSELHKYYTWQSMDSIPHVVRNMLPDGNGEAISVPAGDSVTRTRNFTLDPSWNDRNIEAIAFVQNNSTKEIYQGAKCAVRPAPWVKYLKYDGVLVTPGSNVALNVRLRNIGTGAAQGVAAVLSTADPYVSVTTANATYGDIVRYADGAPSAAFGLSVTSGCPDPHLATMNLEITASNGTTRTSTFPVLVTTNDGFGDNMENGVNNWTHSGLGDQWHQTTHRNHTPTHSWYCGTEGSWQYTNENDARLVMPYFVLGSTSSVSYYHWYAVEPAWDYCMVEANNGSDFWQVLGNYSGSISSFQQVTYDIPTWAQQTMRLRYRFLSDPATVAEGWYVDDFVAGPSSAVRDRENRAGLRVNSLHNPVTDVARISYQVPAGIGALDIFDVSGAVVASWRGLQDEGRVDWNLTDGSGKPVRNGMYFVRLNGEGRLTGTKLVVAR